MEGKNYKVNFNDHKISVHELVNKYGASIGQKLYNRELLKAN